MTPFEQEVAAGTRFEFGKNWAAFLTVLDDARIREAEHSLVAALKTETLSDRGFLDIGCGSGLFSLAAMRLGAARVHSLDYDSRSVACAQELKRRYFPGANHWTIEMGNVLDADYLHRLGGWDIVYAWGVLHHTGNIWQAMASVATVVNQAGLLFISVYNDQGLQSRLWMRVKVFYNRGRLARWLVLAIGVPYFVLGGLMADVLRLKNPLARYVEYKRRRGMSMTHDWSDWLGGYPFEVAKPEQIFDFYRERGFELRWLKTCGGKLGCNEYVFVKT